MTMSDWGDWLPNAIHAADPTGVAIWYLGCNGFVLKANDGTTVFIDPYIGTGDPPRTIRMIPVPFDPMDVEGADAILVTHEHTDHVHGPSQGPIVENCDATIYGPPESLDVIDEERWSDRWAIDDSSLQPVTEGETRSIGSFTLSVEPAHDPDATHPVSYILDHEAGTIFHGGDTKPSDAFADIGNRYDIDLGILAFGTVGSIPDKRSGEPKRTRWYNDENQIIEIATMLELDRLLPSHWDMWKGLTADPTVLHHHARSFPFPNRLEIVEIGDRVDLE